MKRRIPYKKSKKQWITWLLLCCLFAGGVKNISAAEETTLSEVTYEENLAVISADTSVEEGTAQSAESIIETETSEETPLQEEMVAESAETDETELSEKESLSSEETETKEIPEINGEDLAVPENTSSDESKDFEEIEEEEAEEAIEEEFLEQTSAPTVTYRTHVQSIGWQDWKKDGEMSGTQGKSKRLEGIEIKIQGSKNLNIEYKTHIQSYGWESSWKKNGAMSGTQGESKRLEAIRIKLTGTDASEYDVWYCVHAQNYGWLNWAKNGADAGTAGYAYRLEGIKIRILPKGSTAPKNEGSVASAFYSKSTGPSVDSSKSGVAYTTHVQTYGWQDYAYNGEMAGTSGKSKRLEGICIALVNQAYSGDIEYRTHVQTYGWQDWKKNGAMSGTSGESKRLEAIQIRLNGQMAQNYDIYYRVHAQNIGWMGWAKNGEQAGTAGYSFRLEAIQIVLVNKGGAAPSQTLNGNRQTTDTSFIDQKTNRTDFDLDARYGGPDISYVNIYYSGSTLVVDATIYNYRMFQADYYDWITINVYDEYNTLFATKTFRNIPLYMSPYSQKQITFTIENTPIKNINPVNGGGLYMTYDYYYIYTM